jgi:HlyD family secretion protein
VSYRKGRSIKLIGIILVLASTTSCGFLTQPLDSTEPQQSSNSSLTNVDVAIARLGTLKEEAEYIGTTQPVREVAVRSQIEARLLDLYVDIGDRVSQGQIIGTLDDSLLAAVVTREEAELAALESELAGAKIQVNNAQIRLEELLVELQQAENDAARYTKLAETGAISQQQAETFQTSAKVAQQAVLAAREQIRNEEQAVAAAAGRIAAQRAVIDQEKQRQAYSQVISPLSGVVTAKVNEPGNLIQPGGDILTIGDFSRIKIVVPLSELDLGNIFVGQGVEVRLDAFGNETFSGQVSRIAPSADPNSRQVAVEVSMANPDGRIKAGLLARVGFQSEGRSQIIVSESAIVKEGENTSIFVVAETQEERQARVEKRRVQLGTRANGQVEIASGIEPGERFVVRSTNPLTDDETVSLSILSE